MNIGDVVNVRIPLSEHVECQNGCSARAIQYRNGIPFCRECWLAEQQKPWEDEANQFVAWDGTIYEVVRRVS